MKHHDLHIILFSTIKDFEIRESIRREDPAFDAFEHLAAILGYKNPSMLRKMCRPRSEENVAKLGFDEAITIMSVTNDYRLQYWFIEEINLRQAQLGNAEPDPMSAPITSPIIELDTDHNLTPPFRVGSSNKVGSSVTAGCSESEGVL